MQHPSKAFMGKGWAFPVAFDDHTGAVCMLGGEEDIAASIDVLFRTKVGERVMRRDYGSDLHAFLFSPMNRSTITYLKAAISDAILFYEPRIVLEDLTIIPASNGDGVLTITLSYRISATNNRYNYVYPFYVQEGTNLDKSLSPLSAAPPKKINP